MGATVPRRNTFSNANAACPSAIAKDLYWKTYNHLAGIAPKFGRGPRIETFFKELKQTCQIHGVIGYSENAVQWQVWIGLPAHLILRYLRYRSKWGLSFSRLAPLVRGMPWNRRKLIETLRLYGTAGPAKSCAPKPRPLGGPRLPPCHNGTADIVKARQNRKISTST